MIDSNYDNFFDMAVVGDTDGQLWTIDMLNPGTLSGGLVTNWYGGVPFHPVKGDSHFHGAPVTTQGRGRVVEQAEGGVGGGIGCGRPGPSQVALSEPPA